MKGASASFSTWDDKKNKEPSTVDYAATGGFQAILSWYEEKAMKTFTIMASTIVLLWLATPVHAQQIDVYAQGLVNPIGIEVDANGLVWVAEQGTGSDDGQISVVTTDGQVHPFLTGLRSVLIEGETESAQHLGFQDGQLWVTYGLSSITPEGYLLRVDTTGFAPGDPPLSVNDAEVIDIGTFVLGEGFDETNPYNFTVGPDDDLFITDASANAIIRREAASGTLSVFAELDSIANPTQIGAPYIDAVPTSIVFAGDRFYVSQLTGFPFLDEMASIFEVDLDGNVSVLQDEMTLLVDLAVHPVNGALFVLQISQFDPAQGFLPNTGAVFAVRNGLVRPQVSELSRPAGMAFNGDGDLFVTSYDAGEVLLIPAALVTAADPDPGVPAAFTLDQNYPNPFNPATTITYTLNRRGYVRLAVYDVLGRQVAVLADAVRSAGTYTADFEAPGLPSGIYIYRLEADGLIKSRKMILQK